jgi:quercetin dioxygenase-like cupin family protein
MKACRLLPVASLVLLCSGTLAAQDPVKVDPAHYKVVFENASVRVLRIAYPTGATSAMHSHPDAIMIPLGSAKGRFALADGKSEDREMTNEVALYTPAATHNPSNVGTTPLDGLLIEFKAPAPGTATLPTERPGMTVKVLAEGPRAVAFRMTADPSFTEPAGSTHEYDQIVVALSASKMSLAIDGKTPKESWARGDVQFIGRGVPHASKNAAGKPVDFIIIAIK